MDRIARNDLGTVTIDLLFAIVLVIGATFAAFIIMPNISYEDRDWRIKQYMTATRATDNLVQDEGEPGWEEKWKSANYSNVTKIGLEYTDADISMHKLLDKMKVEALMGQGYMNSTTDIIWWEFPNSTTSTAEREHASRVLGLSGYNFYMQLHPVGLYPEIFDPAPLKTNLSNVMGMISTATVVDRYVYIKNPGGDEHHKYLEFDNEVIHYRLNLWVW